MARLKSLGSAALVLAALGSSPAGAQSVSRPPPDFFEALGRPVGGLFRGALGPSVEKVRDEASGLLAEVDDVLENRGEQVRDIIAETDGRVERRLNQANEIIAAQVGNLSGLGKDLAAQARAVVRDSSREVGAAATGVIRETGATTKAVIKDADARLQERIAQVSGEVNVLVAHAGSEVNQVLLKTNVLVEARLAQADEAVLNRLANTDAVVAKQLISLEASALKLLALAGMLGFFLLGLNRAAIDIMAALDGRGSLSAALWKALCRLAVNAAVMLLLGGVFYWLAQELPGGSYLRARELRRENGRLLTDALEGMNVPLARFHASQLRVLADADTPLALQCRAIGFMSSSCQPAERQLTPVEADRQLELLQLVRRVLNEPGLLATAEGRSTLEADLVRYEAGRSPTHDQQDSRRHALEAPTLEALRGLIALSRARTARAQVLALAQLAPACVAYQEAQRPFDEPWLGRQACRTLAVASRLGPSAQLHEAVAKAPPVVLKEKGLKTARDLEERLARLATFQTATAAAQAALFAAQLEVCRRQPRPTRGSSPGGSASAQAQAAAACEGLAGSPDRTALEAALGRRTEAAREVLRSWSRLLEEVPAEPGAALSGVTAHFLLLDDALFSLAAAVTHQAQEVPLPVGLQARKLELKLKSLPPRLAGLSAPLDELGPRVRRVAALVEGERFVAHEEANFRLFALLANGSRDEVAQAELVALLELKGLTTKALELGWLSRDAYASAVAQSASQVPARQLAL